MDDDHKPHRTFKLTRRAFTNSSSSSSPSLPIFETIRFNFSFEKQASYMHLVDGQLHEETNVEFGPFVKKFMDINLWRFLVLYKETYEKVFRVLSHHLPFRQDECKQLIEFAYKEALTSIIWPSAYSRDKASRLHIDIQIFVGNRYVYGSFNGSDPFNGSDDHENCCSICLEELFDKSGDVIGLPCSHVFHKDCLQEWVDKTNNCPLCRFQLDF